MTKKSNKGWVKIYRQITDSAVWTSSEPFDRRSAWIDLILMANHEERQIQLRNGTYQTIGVGQCFTSMDHLAKRWGWSRNKVIRYLKQLSAQHMCTATGTPNGTLLTIEKYDFFQGGRTTERTTDDTANRTTDGTTDGTRTRIRRINKQECNNKNEPEAQFSSRGVKYE